LQNYCKLYNLQKKKKKKKLKVLKGGEKEMGFAQKCRVFFFFLWVGFYQTIKKIKKKLKI